MLKLILNYPLFFLKIMGSFLIIKCTRRNAPKGDKIFRWDRQFFRGDPSKDKLIYALYFRGWHEFFTSAIMDKFIKNGMTVLDVGAHLGWSSLYMARRVGLNGKVLAFEPSKVLTPHLRENILINKYQNIQVYDKALTEKDIDMNITHSKINSSSNSSKVACTTFDTFYKNSSLGKIDFVKIDIEGFEMGCLIGMSAFIESNKPPITVEVHGSFLHEFGYTAKDVINFLEGFSYKIFYSESIGQEELISTQKHFHILALPF